MFEIAYVRLAPDLDLFLWQLFISVDGRVEQARCRIRIVARDRWCARSVRVCNMLMSIWVCGWLVRKRRKMNTLGMD